MSTEPLDPTMKLNPDMWYLYGDEYDFSAFVDKHPGGRQAITLGQGRDCTALVESYHTKLPAKALLAKYRVRENAISNNTFSYAESGLYRKVKMKAVEYFRRNGYQHTKGGAVELLLWLFNLSAMLACLYGACSVHQPLPFFNTLAAVAFGVCKSLLVIRSTHSASHFALSTSARVNRFVYWLNMALLGDTPQQWTAKHVIAHHIDTNVTPIDDDTMYPIKRVLPSLEVFWYHRFQQYYIWVLYMFVYVPWSVSHNIKLFYGLLFGGGIYEGTVPVRLRSALDLCEMLSCVLVHYYVRLTPFLYCQTWAQAVIIALICELSSSLWFSLQFAVNHETAEAVALSGAAKSVFGDQRDFGVHQIVTSHNYSPDNRFSLELSGGLNYQIEHHLFPSVHFKHYPQLSLIVREVANEFNLHYNSSLTFLIGVQKHYQLLKTMGQPDAAAN